MHISEYEWGHPETLEGVIHVGDEFQVKVIAFDEKNGKIKLSRKALLPKPVLGLPTVVETMLCGGEAHLRPAPRRWRKKGRKKICRVKK